MSSSSSKARGLAIGLFGRIAVVLVSVATLWSTRELCPSRLAASGDSPTIVAANSRDYAAPARR